MPSYRCYWSAPKFLDADDVRKLRAVYQNVDDIDLFAGGVLETEHRDALVGPVFKVVTIKLNETLDSNIISVSAG